MSDWDDDDYKDGDYYSFKDAPAGTTISGTLIKVDKAAFTEKGVTKYAPQVTLKDDITGEPKTLTAGAFRLKQAFVEARPVAGDHVKVTLTGELPIGGGQSVKQWELIVNGGAPQAAPVAVAPPVAAPVAQAAPVASTVAVADPAAVAAAVANLTPEQLALIGLGGTPVPA